MPVRRRKAQTVNAAPLGRRPILARAEGFQRVVAVLENRLGRLAGENIREMAEKEPARGAQDCRHRLLRLDPPVDQPNPALAHVAMPAGARVLAEHGEQRLAPASRRLAKRHEVVELRGLDALALLGRSVVENLAPPQLDVARAIERERVGGQAVAAGAADLLIIGLDRGGHVGVKDEADVGLVDAHAEGDGRADDAIVLALKGVLSSGA